jgi:hypothetical protein
MRVPVRPRRPLVPAALLSAAAAAFAYGCAAGGGGAPDEAPGAAGTAAQVAFRNTVSGPPPGWQGPVFQLSHNYPASIGACPNSVCRWLAAPAPFNSTRMADWQPYLDAILAYVIAGQTTDLNNQAGWRDVVNGETRWFHVPWMAYNPKAGREFVHGTTNERTADISDFVGIGQLHAAIDGGGIEVEEVPPGLHTLPGASGGKKFESWAVGMYNPWGGYTIGQAVPANGIPRAVSTSGGNGALPARFPLGSLVVKVLFTSASGADVPYLKGSPQWTVDRHDTVGGTSRSPQPVWLAQMDVAVRDDRSPTGWVYGTYGYNGNLPGRAWWERMAPVGVQWGNDPQSWPAVDSARSRPIVESAINRNIGIYEHLGCNGRLAGPVDNPQSGCMSCHQGAYAPLPVGTKGSYGKNIPPIFGFTNMCVRNATTPDSTNAMNTAYFSNVTYPNPMSFPKVSGPTANLDTSLQLQVGYLQYANWLAAQ